MLLTVGIVKEIPHPFLVAIVGSPKIYGFYCIMAEADPIIYTFLQALPSRFTDESSEK